MSKPNRVYDIEVLPNCFMFGCLDTVKKDAGLENLPTMYKLGIWFNDEELVIRSYRAFAGTEPQNRKKPSDHSFLKNSNGTSGLLQIYYNRKTKNLTYYKTTTLWLTDFFSTLENTNWFMGFNNYHYDDPIFQLFINKLKNFNEELSYEKTAEKIDLHIREILPALYQESKNIIEMEKKPIIPSHEVQFRTIDLKKIARVDKSLKLIGANLNYPQIMDFPVDPHKDIDIETAERLWNYLTYDLEITQLFAKTLSPHLNLRKDISMKYGVNAMNLDDTGIASLLFEKLYCEFTGMKRFDFLNARNKIPVDRRIKLGDVISPIIQFRTQKMKDYLKKISSRIIKTDGDKITLDLPDAELGDIKYTLGAGGIHSQDGNGIFVSDPAFEFIDCDVTSYYVYLIINNKIFPEHLDENFCKFLETLVVDRVKAKNEGNKVVDKSLKTVILSIFGKMGESFSPIYSPKGFLSVTINGQLFLLMLAEMFELNGIRVVSANTDGIVTRVPTGSKQVYKDCCDAWMQTTGFNLEFTKYTMYARTTVNDYLAVTDSGDIKLKGDFVDQQEFTKGHIAKVVPKSVKQYFISKYVDNNPMSIEDIVNNNNEITDYLYAKKPVTKGWKNYILTPTGGIHDIPDTVRFAVVKKSFPHRVRLYKYKIKEGYEAKTSYIANEYVGIMNTLYDPNCAKITDIKKDYYIQQCKKMINLIESGNSKNLLTLFD